MKLKSLFIIITVNLFFLSACTDKNCQTKILYPETAFNNDHLLMAVLYQQQAAECKAMYYQAFNLAQLMLDKDLADKKQKGKRAVVVDIDETILDNSPFEAKVITKNAKSPYDWISGASKAKAKNSPGTASFLNYVAAKGVEVFYVTNRSEKESEATIKNLKEEHFPMADTIHLMLKANESSKEIRRQKILEKYHIVLLMGDNLTDFAADFDKTTAEVRDAKVNELRKEFGKRFIMLPNAMYGDWERAMYDAYKADTTKTKAEIRKMLLKDF